MPRLELITGPAGCGKTHHCIETFLDNRGQTTGLSPVFFILPNREHAERIHDLLLRKRPGGSEAPKGLLDPAILTINEFLKRMGGIALAKTPGDVLRHALIRTVLAQEKLRYFASSREAPGFVPLVARFIAEAKANFVTARDFETRLEPLLTGDSVFSKKLADLVTLFRGYEERLRSFGLADPDDLLRDFVEKASREGRSSAWRQARHKALASPSGRVRRAVWRTRPSGVGIIQAGARWRGLGPPLVIFDGFYHFTRAQMEFLRAVSERVQQVIVTLTLDERPERAHVFEYAESTRKSLLAMGFRESRWGSKGNFRTGEDALRHLERNLFLPAPASFERPQESVRMFEATGASGEIEMVAREILRLYRDGPYHYSDFCLILRTIGPYEALIRSVFASFGIPVAVHERRRLRENPFIHAFLQWIRLLSNGWRRDAMAALLASGYYGFPPEEVAQLKTAILEADVGEGREAWSSFLESYQGGGRHILEALLAWHAKLVAESSPSGFAAVLRAFIGKFGLIQRLADASESTREDFQAYRSLRKIMDEILLSHGYRGGRPVPAGSASSELGLATELWRVRPDESPPHSAGGFVRTDSPRSLANAAQCGGRGGGAMSLEEYLARLLDAADLSLFSVPERSKNCVQVYDIAFALQKEYKVIFLAGMLEQLFPQKIAEDALLKDEERAELNRLGLPFEERRRRVAGERYFFYMAVTRARERLYLTYPKFDLEGKESLPSFYVEELKRCFQPACLPVRTKGLWEVAPEPGEICGREDLYAALVARLFEKRREIPEEEPSLCAALVNECLGDTAYRRVLASVLRDEDKAWLEDPEILAHFAGWKGPLSATRLELFATCPFKHFSAKVLRLQEKRAGLDPVLMGSLFHKVLEEFYRETRVRRKEDWVFLRDKEKAKKLLFEKLDGLARSPDFAFAGAKKFRKALLRLRLREILDDFVEEESRMERERRTVPHLFEYVFGADEPSGTLRIPAAAGPSQQGRHHPGWGAEEEEILLQGKIDRIDLDPETGLAVVIDYKSGRYKSDQLMKNLEKGVELQIPVYILAARELLGYRVAGGELYPVTDPTGRRGLYDRALMAGVGKYAARSAGALESGDFEAALERVKEQIVDDVARLRRGQIAIRSKGCDHCPYNHVCRFEKWKLIYSEQEPAGSRV